MYFWPLDDVAISLSPPSASTVKEKVKDNNETFNVVLHVNKTEGSIAIFHCGNLTKGKVTWSRDFNGQRVDILTTYNGETTKHIADPDRRYSSGADIVLIIFRVSQSDAGRYYCSGATMELTVIPDTLHVNQTEGNIATLYCGKLIKGTVTWSRDINGQRVDILTTHNGETTKHIADPDRRYSSGGGLALVMYRVSQSDAGRYYCNRTTVELTVISGGHVAVSLNASPMSTVKEKHTGHVAVSLNASPMSTVKEKHTDILHVSWTEGSIAILHCGKPINGTVTWSRDIDGQRIDILTTHDGEMTKHIADPDRRYRSSEDLALNIFRVSQSDAGRYHCVGATVELSVIPGGVSVLETVLMFGGVGVAALIFLLATVAAGSVILYQNRETGQQREMPSSSVNQISHPELC
ncbi:hypothetical protein MHYP_G00173340 [Metynnis hypsauchen]